jgi:hypothetical protein
MPLKPSLFLAWLLENNVADERLYRGLLAHRWDSGTYAQLQETIVAATELRQKLVLLGEG